MVSGLHQIPAIDVSDMKSTSNIWIAVICWVFSLNGTLNTCKTLVTDLFLSVNQVKGQISEYMLGN